MRAVRVRIVPIRILWGVAALALGCGAARALTWAGEPEPSVKTFKVAIKEDITYFEGLAADRAMHQLDLYIPEDNKGFPVLFFVHGGGWTLGDKSGDLGIHRVIAQSLARHGIGVVLPNYRLSPRVKFPAHAQDVARAFAWTVKHVKEYGGRTDAIFLSGHSAGGHLAALLATEPCFLKAEGLTTKSIRGVIPISGVYEVPNKALFDSVFGTDPEARKKASPLFCVRASLPPFLIIHADKDFSTCGKAASDAFYAALLAKKNTAEVKEIKDRNHLSIMLRALAEKDPVRLAIADFIRKNTPPLKKN